MPGGGFAHNSGLACVPYQIMIRIMFFIPAHITLNMIYGIVPPFLPLLLRSHGYSPALVGILLALAEGTGILGPFLFGRLADRRGSYKWYIICAYLLSAAAALPIAFFVHPALSGLLACMLITGYRSANPLIDAVTTINLGEKGDYGKIRVSGSISYCCFVFLLQWVPVLRPNTPVNISIWICITVVLAIASIIFVPEKYARRETVPEHSHAEAQAANKKSIWTPIFILGLSSIVLSRLAMAPVYSFFSLFLVEYVQWDAVGLMWSLAGLAEIPLLYFSNRIIRRFGALPILAFTSAMVALRLGVYALFPVKAGIALAQILHCFCFGLFHPAAVAFISNSVPPEHRSFGMTLYLSVGCGIPLFIGNFIGGFIADTMGYRFLFGLFSIFAVLGAAIYMFFPQKIIMKRRV
jgi:PPP family 3-phenylpropionic acid transporter